MASSAYAANLWTVAAECGRGMSSGGRRRTHRRSRVKCRAESSSTSRSSSKNDYYGYDLYQLLGVDNNAHQLEIKRAYRWLQKKCHPDIAGEIGHDMSILLNEAYAVLSDPNTRSSYDTVRAEWIQYEGFTGEPLYSKWMGPPCEETAVFVDEVRCIGCLKCALIASNTFAVEEKFGRARAVSQWADPKPVIDDAIRACPVDCISWVDRSKLAALEYLMSKQPRFAASVDETSAGQRAIDVFKATDKFLKKNAQFQSQKESSAKGYRTSAADVIQARAGRWWHFFVGKSYSSSEESDQTRSSQRAVVPLGSGLGRSIFAESKLRALYEAVTQQRLSSGQQEADYWVPLKQEQVEATNSVRNPRSVITPKMSSSTAQEQQQEQAVDQQEKSKITRKDLLLGAVPVAASLVAGFYVGMFESGDASFQPPGSGPLQTVISHNLLLQELMRSGLIQPVLAAIAWYVITVVALRCFAILFRF